jgi:hypothetical protein
VSERAGDRQPETWSFLAQLQNHVSNTHALKFLSGRQKDKEGLAGLGWHQPRALEVVLSKVSPPALSVYQIASLYVAPRPIVALAVIWVRRESFQDINIWY